MHVYSSYSHFQTSGLSFNGGAQGSYMNQMMGLMQQFMSLLSSQIPNGRRGFCQLPQQPNFGAPGQFGGGQFGNPGLSNFCGGSPNLNLNLNGLPPNANVNINIGGQQQNCPPAHCGGQFQQMQCGGRNGQLKQDGKGKPISYTTRGGYQVTVNKHDISIKDPNGNEVKHHGDPHENLNGKHIKDWKGKQRSVVLADGTKITMSADGPQGVTQHTSIYDGRQNVQIANGKNQIEHHSMNGFDTMSREFAQFDGETAMFTSNQQGDGMYYNIYNQAANGAVTYGMDWLGQASGGQVHDMYDDPRLKKT